MKKLLLASNGKVVIEEGLKLLFGNDKKIKLAYITTAGNCFEGEGREYLKRHKDKIKELGYNFEEIDIKGKNEDELMALLKDKDAVYVEGGNTYYLLKAVRESGFDKVIKELIEKGIAYIGSSAGSYIMCPTIEMTDWKPNDKDKYGVTDFTALNLVPFLVFAHYLPELEDILREKVANAKYPVKILKDGQAILVENDNYKLVGEGGEVKL